MTTDQMSKLTPLRAARLKCLDCMCGQPKEVRECPSIQCALHQYRMGRNPRRTGLGGKFIQIENESTKNTKSAEENHEEMSGSKQVELQT